MTLNVCACAGRVATIVNAQTSVSAKAGSHRSLAKVNTECCTGFVIMIPFTECDRGRLLFARAPHFIPDIDADPDRNLYLDRDQYANDDYHAVSNQDSNGHCD